MLVFAVPASPLAQPWAVIGGNTLSALVGIVCATWIPDPALGGRRGSGAGHRPDVQRSAACTRRAARRPCSAVLTHTTHFSSAFFPCSLNSLLLALAGVAYNTLTGRRYPHVQVVARPPASDARFSQADIDAVLARYNQVLDISRDDLQSLIQQTELRVVQAAPGHAALRRHHVAHAGLGGVRHAAAGSRGR